MATTNPKATTKAIETSPIKTPGYIVELSTAATVAAGMRTLPIYQTIRGAKQWSADKRAELVEAVKAGLYIPPIVYGYEVDDEGKRYLVIDDGQQRGNAIAEGLADGRLTGKEPVLVAIDTKRTGADLFRALNIGVPVGSALVTAVSLEGNAGDVLLKIADSDALSLIPWSAIQSGRTERAAFAASLLAIMAGWTMPESSTKATEAWLKAHAEEVTVVIDGRDKGNRVKSTLERSMDAVKAIAAALKVHADIVADGKDKDRVKIARRALASVRKKNNWVTLCQLLADGCDAADAIALFADGEIWKSGTPVPVRSADGKSRIKRTEPLPLGGGSSGNPSDTQARYNAALYYIAEGGDYRRDPYSAIVPKDGATATAAETKAAEVAENMDDGALNTALKAESKA